MGIDSTTIAGLVVATVGGAAVGVERQRSGHASGPAARLGGIRTFTLFGALAGIAGLLLQSNDRVPVGALLVAAAAALVVAGYVRASRRDVDATTEVAALVVIGAGVLAGLQQLQLSAGLNTFTVLLLAEKTRLHKVVSRLDQAMLLAAARFAVMSTVILPLLPEGPFGPGPGVRPRELWMLVMLFSGISFAGFIAQRLTGRAGYALTGLLGGLVSSTSVTLSFARLSATHRPAPRGLVAGAVAASTVLFVRVLVVVSLLNAALVPVLVKYLALPFAVAIIMLAFEWRSLDGPDAEPPPQQNPLQLRSAVEMALLFQVVLFVVFYVRASVGDAGLPATGFLLGLTDVDALSMSMSRSVAAGASVDAACRAIATGVVANSMLKAALAFAIGRDGFKWRAGGALAAMAGGGVAALAF